MELQASTFGEALVFAFGVVVAAMAPSAGAAARYVRVLHWRRTAGPRRSCQVATSGCNVCKGHCAVALRWFRALYQARVVQEGRQQIAHLLPVVGFVAGKLPQIAGGFVLGVEPVSH